MKFDDARKYKKEIKKLYREAFPADERAPLFLLFKKTNNGRDEFSAILDDNNNFTGLTRRWGRRCNGAMTLRGLVCAAPRPKPRS